MDGEPEERVRCASLGADGASHGSPAERTSNGGGSSSKHSPHGKGILSRRHTADRKKSLKWDETNLKLNAEEMILNPPKMKIDEPKTPFVASEDLPSEHEEPEVIHHSKLQGFSEAETDYHETKMTKRTKSSGSSTTATPHSREEFIRMRKDHYHHEFVKLGKSIDELAEEDAIASASLNVNTENDRDQDENPSQNLNSGAAP
ncbi:hypothetical protein FVE85_2147 [Porphyridium purpureum]|uniref:Protein phosphatase inhibitor 2 n=1 Tax=Porphyridium purpureum TaxID=35688 RepID=A0A5J4YYN3_PORPP|nr:hypothetical protein FVE85_2147 [Porphyridium purpureum]|eukprot:POR8020..scf209_3